MNLKKYEGRTMKEALDRVKADLGGNAVILHTKSYRRGGFLGLGGRDVVEITASDDVRVLERNARPAKSARISAARPGLPPRAGAAVLESAYGAADHLPPPATLPDAALKSIEAEVGNIKSLVGDMIRREHKKGLKNCADHLIDLYHALLMKGVDEKTAKTVVRGADGAAETDPALHVEAVAGMLRTAPPIERGGKKVRTIALVGPTGVGKTTTIAKLAANFKLREKLDVGLITIDTYRIAAVEQLKTYADIIGIPVNVVLTPEELAGAIKAFRDKDIVLVDTAGRSQCDAQKMEELKRFLQPAGIDEVHLVVSATTHTALLQSIIEKFGPLSDDRMILTKIDEAPCRGHLLNVLFRVNKALSYVTAGQEVPDDIEAADAHKIARIALGA